MFKLRVIQVLKFVLTAYIGMGVATIIEYGFNIYTVLLTTLPVLGLLILRFLFLRIKGVL